MDLKKDDSIENEANIPTKSTAEVHSSGGGDESDDDVPTLSAYALEALKDFLATNGGVDGGDTVSLPQEDWRLSQFWYSPDTATAVADEVYYLLSSHFSDASADISVACIACPTLFAYLKKLYPNIPAQLFEFDQRFQQHGSDFTFYDYNLPEELPQAMKHTYRIIVADPPYLSEECLEKVAQTIAFLAHPEKIFLLLLTGAVQTERASKLLGLRPCGFQPEHSSKLGNEFRLFTNYDPGERLGGWESREE